jgi:hypothetical protein
MNYYKTKERNSYRRVSFTKYLTGLFFELFKLEYNNERKI